MATPQLADLLAGVLPKHIKLNVRHLSTPPRECEAVFSAPPGEPAEQTFCENHFFVATLNKHHYHKHDHDRNEEVVDDEIAVLGIEVAIYSTDRLTILFVSKADSSGYLHLLNETDDDNHHNAARKVSLNLIATTFLSFLIQTHQRKGVRLVLSLFARAQNQYLFPGSVDNKHKHVLDDRGLIKWWCRAADPILREKGVESSSQATSRGTGSADVGQKVEESMNSSATAYLLVPGCDRYETRAFFPPSARTDNPENPRWRISYPLSQICSHPHAPPRCLVPRFPDDPKARFLVDLDDELPQKSEDGGESNEGSGQWKSVKSLDEFWEMMSFRQECSAGRLVGFLWLVINPPGVLSSDELSNQPQNAAVKGQDPVPSHTTAAASTTTEAKSDDRALSSLQVPTSHPDANTESYRPAFFWPEAGRGEVILSEADYKAGNDVLLEQDFETEELAMAGTMAWIRKVAALADLLWWGQPIIGKREVSSQSAAPLSSSSAVPVATINPGMIVRKRKKESQDTTSNTSTLDSGQQPSDTAKDAEPGVNLLSASFVRKKKKA